MIKVVGIVIAVSAAYLAVAYVLRTWAAGSNVRQMVVAAVTVSLALIVSDHLIQAPLTWVGALQWLVVGSVAGAAATPLIRTMHGRYLKVGAAD